MLGTQQARHFPPYVRITSDQGIYLEVVKDLRKPQILHIMRGGVKQRLGPGNLIASLDSQSARVDYRAGRVCRDDLSMIANWTAEWRVTIYKEDGLIAAIVRVDGIRQVR